ncbi:unnamed protein product [Debaryomyces tyrocola]|nr:unnamed protein product [Debaryomyces tyrocola]
MIFIIQKNSAARFRSGDIRVMSPARFHCATALNPLFILNSVSCSNTEELKVILLE